MREETATMIFLETGTPPSGMLCADVSWTANIFGTSNDACIQ
jgi:hypothetical protein